MKRRGLSLLELVVAISLLYLVVTFVIELLPTNLYALVRGQSRMTAENLAYSQALEQAQRPFSELPIGHTQSLPPVILESKTYRGQLEVLAAASEDSSRLRLLRVTVNWQDRGAARQVSRETWIQAAGP